MARDWARGKEDKDEIQLPGSGGAGCHSTLYNQCAQLNGSHMAPFFCTGHTYVCVPVSLCLISSLISCLSQIPKTRGKCSLALADTAACGD